MEDLAHPALSGAEPLTGTLGPEPTFGGDVVFPVDLLTASGVFLGVQGRCTFDRVLDVSVFDESPCEPTDLVKHPRRIVVAFAESGTERMDILGCPTHSCAHGMPFRGVQEDSTLRPWKSQATVMGMPDPAKFPQGAAWPAVLLTAEERDARQRPRGKVSLIPHVRSAEVVEPLADVSHGEGWPDPVRTWVALLARHGRRMDAWRQVVKPTNHRGIRSQKIVTVFYVRAWVGRWCVMRAWRSSAGNAAWTTGYTAVFRQWRDSAVGQRISVAEAKAVVVTGEYVWQTCNACAESDHKCSTCKARTPHGATRCAKHSKR